MHQTSGFAYLNGSQPDNINLAICIFCMYIIWLEKWTWAKLYKTVHWSVYMVSCMNDTVQLTDTSIVNNLKRHLKLNCLNWGSCGKIRKGTSYMILPHHVHPCLSSLSFACIKKMLENRVPLKSKNDFTSFFWHFFYLSYIEWPTAFSSRLVLHALCSDQS